MKINDYILGLFLCCILLPGLGACGDAGGGEEYPADGGHKVDFSIRVSVPTDRRPASRAAGDIYPEDPVSDNERIQTLRIIIVRPDNTVEANQAVTLTAPASETGYVTMKVQPNEKKRVYLFANERAVSDVVARRLIDYDLSGIRVGTRFPREQIENLPILLDPTEQIAGLLPMSGCHEVEVPFANTQKELFVTRAAVKFTFHITNNSDRGFNLTRLTMERTADREYLLPRDAVFEEHEYAGKKFIDIVQFSMPDNTLYHTFDVLSKARFGNGTYLKAKGGETETSEPVYLLEGKYVDPAGDGRNYAVEMVLDDLRFRDYLPNLPQLARNTHAKVNITIGNAGIAWQVDVIPYSEVILKPDFGL